MAMLKGWHVGVALVALGCSDPVPPPAKAGITFQLGKASGAASCPQTVSGETAGVGNPPPSPLPNPSPGGRVADGENGHEVSCTVRGSSPFEFSGRLVGANTSPFANDRAGTGVTVTILESSVPSGGAGTARMSFITAATAPVAADPDQPCTLTASGNGFEVKEGAIYASFSCPLLLEASSPDSGCQASGVLVFENCATE